ncbi:4188_t:CDS:2 [Entrophospora sp. SA101]|nr:4188_t:CDS:2 [Entrophospora sp. SA101]
MVHHVLNAVENSCEDEEVKTLEIEKSNTNQVENTIDKNHLNEDN